MRLSCDTRFIRDRCAKRTLSTRTASRNALTRATRKRSPFRTPSMAPMKASLRTHSLHRTNLRLPSRPGNSHPLRIHSFCTVLGRILSAESRPDSRQSVKVSLQPGPILLATAPMASASIVAAAILRPLAHFLSMPTPRTRWDAQRLLLIGTTRRLSFTKPNGQDTRKRRSAPIKLPLCCPRRLQPRPGRPGLLLA
jgi:hypothetical protein